MQIALAGASAWFSGKCKLGRNAHLSFPLITERRLRLTQLEEPIAAGTALTMRQQTFVVLPVAGVL